MNLPHSADSIGEQDMVDDARYRILVVATQSGEHSFFSDLGNRSEKRIYLGTRNRQNAEDALQEAFEKVLAYLQNVDERSMFSAWFKGILRKKHAHLRASMSWSVDGETWQHWEISDQGSKAEEHYLKEESERHLREAIRCLRPTHRRIVEIEQLPKGSTKEIAEAAGISGAGTESRLPHARTCISPLPLMNDRAILAVD